jgi:large subunit ribosomal protein L10
MPRALLLLERIDRWWLDASLVALKGGESRMPTPQKAAVIDELTEQLSRANLAILTDYRGLNVGDIQGLRAQLRPQNAEFHIAKNTFTRIAAERAGINGLEPVLEGPLALVFAYGDMAGPAKTISDFARTSRILTIKGGVLESQFINPAQVEDVASLPSREVLLGKLVGMLASPMSRMVGVLGGPSRSVAYVLNSRAEQLGGAPEAQAAD